LKKDYIDMLILWNNVCQTSTIHNDSNSQFRFHNPACVQQEKQIPQALIKMQKSLTLL